jgi:hypothetical protein
VNGITVVTGTPEAPNVGEIIFPADVNPKTLARAARKLTALIRVENRKVYIRCNAQHPKHSDARSQEMHAAKDRIVGHYDDITEKARAKGAQGEARDKQYLHKQV